MRQNDVDVRVARIFKWVYYWLLLLYVITNPFIITVHLVRILFIKKGGRDMI
jgi:hypothetical protein